MKDILLGNPRELEWQLLNDLCIDTVLNHTHGVLTLLQNHFRLVFGGARLWNRHVRIDHQFEHGWLEPPVIENVNIVLYDLSLVRHQSPRGFESDWDKPYYFSISYLIMEEAHLDWFFATALRLVYFERLQFLVSQKVLLLANLLLFLLNLMLITLDLRSSTPIELIESLLINSGSNVSLLLFRYKVSFFLDLCDVKLVKFKTSLLLNLPRVIFNDSWQVIFIVWDECWS